MDKISIKEYIIPKGLFIKSITDYFRSGNQESNKAEYDLCKAFAICNNVRMEIIDDKKCLNASSPDEIAMVEFFE